MQLQRGQTLLHFTLVEKIGEGGMGEVWKAVDRTLDREVAIKILPDAVSGDRERVARFEREAKLLAALSHPNIAGIYGFPEADVSAPGGGKLRFLAMELVRGEDLSQILARGPMPVSEALDAAQQIATALEVAHASGIIHRDLKPANIKRTPEGQIKVLDFGLAKALDAAEAPEAPGATVTSAGSVPGLILGSTSYMSPEQARGQAVNRRTDIWAFGCVLFEMLSGTRAFDGATVTDVLAAVVTGEPQWNKLPAATPPAVRSLLRRCLEKDARKRLRDAGDASLLLEDNPEDAGATASRAAPTQRTARVSPMTRTTFALAGLLMIAAVAIGWWMGHRRTSAQRSTPVTFHRVSFNRGMIRAARFAPDGRTIVYSAAWDGPPIKLYMSRTESPDAAPIALPPAELLAISKSGELAVSLGHAYYGWMADGTLARAPLMGGAPREVLERVRAADWSSDESQFAISRRVPGGDQLECPVGTVLDRTGGYFGDVRISPDGKHVAYTDHGAWGDNRGNVAVVDLAGKKSTLVRDLESVQGLAWTPDGKEVLFTEGSGDQGLLAAVDLTGRMRVVYSSIASIELFDVAPDGRLLLGLQKPEKETLALLAGYAEPRSLVIPGEASLSRSITSDGRAVLVANHSTHDYDTFLVRSDQPGAVRMASGDPMGISPDRAWLMTTSADYQHIFVTPMGMGAARMIPNPEGIEYQSVPAWLPDSRHFVVTGRKGTDPSRGFVCDLEGGATKPFASAGVMWSLFTLPPVSPDGTRVVLQDADRTLKIWPIDGGDAIPIPGVRPDDQPLTFTDDGNALFVTGRSVPIEIERLNLVTGERTPWRTVAPTDRAGLRYALATITPNGKYWALSTAKVLTDLYVVEGLR